MIGPFAADGMLNGMAPDLSQGAQGRAWRRADPLLEILGGAKFEGAPASLIAPPWRASSQPSPCAAHPMKAQ